MSLRDDIAISQFQIRTLIDSLTVLEMARRGKRIPPDNIPLRSERARIAYDDADELLRARKGK